MLRHMAMPPQALWGFVEYTTNRTKKNGYDSPMKASCVLRLRLSLAALTLVVASPVFAQGDPNTLQRIIDEAKNRNQVMDHLTYLTQQIGHRLTGSPNLQRACEWTVKKFKEYGLTNVHMERWGEIPVGFHRGKGGFGRMVKPFVANFQYTSPSWTPGTDGPLRAPAVLEPTTMEEYEKVKDKLKGAWLLTKRPAQRRGGTTEPTELEKLVDASGFAGKVFGSRNELVITSGRFNDLKWEDLPKERRVTIRKSDFDRVLYNLGRGLDVMLEFNLDQKFIKGPMPVFNVIADIKGTEKPDEVVIVSGHLDSWDGPGTEGCCDNGTGTMVALETARVLMKSGAKPKRTIRFIMWTGEEQGLYGSRRYVEMHKNELDKISAVLVDDGGTNYQGGMTCVAAMEPMLRAAQAPMTGTFANMPFEIRVSERMPRGGGSDHAPFNQVGVPGFFWFETGRANYNYVHHTQHDKLSMAIPEYLVQSVCNSAVMSYNLACADTLLPRAIPPANPGN